ncbi:hypothetical protein IGI04_028385 [Brassica rapa subsp. trilocularis]|uniref:Uncharacterized protein n=1 Tax=Brassica rapa subsp. trilocularis TaxID=1813537 RepID=A0ABQ7L1R9_BRACM|nr:hypothetical protein IGI04_028385 [Brassica rapa subsp. trilocularis]
MIRFKYPCVEFRMNAIKHELQGQCMIFLPKLIFSGSSVEAGSGMALWVRVLALIIAATCKQRSNIRDEDVLFGT